MIEKFIYENLTDLIKETHKYPQLAQFKLLTIKNINYY